MTKCTYVEFSPLKQMTLFVITSKKELKRLEKLYDIKVDRDNTSDASAFYWRDENGYTKHAICFMKPSRSIVQDAALIAHEACHVAENYFRSIGEDNPGSETIAYTVQEITQIALEVIYGRDKGSSSDTP